MLLHDGGRAQCGLQAVGASMAHHAAKRPQRLSCLFPVIGKVAEILLYLSGGPAAVHNFPLGGAKCILCRRRGWWMVMGDGQTSRKHRLIVRSNPEIG